MAIFSVHYRFPCLLVILYPYFSHVFVVKLYWKGKWQWILYIPVSEEEVSGGILLFDIEFEDISDEENKDWKIGHK